MRRFFEFGDEPLFPPRARNIVDQDKNDYLQIAAETIKESLSSWPKMTEWLEERQDLGTNPKPLHAYVGVYWNAIHDWSVEVLLNHGQLNMCFQGNHKRTCPFHHYYHHDIFSWLLTRCEDVIHYGRFPVTWAPFYLISVQTDGKTEAVTELVWKHDAGVPVGEIFRKDSPAKMEL